MPGTEQPYTLDDAKVDLAKKADYWTSLQRDAPLDSSLRGRNKARAETYRHALHIVNNVTEPQPHCDAAKAITAFMEQDSTTPAGLRREIASLTGTVLDHDSTIARLKRELEVQTSVVNEQATRIVSLSTTIKNLTAEVSRLDDEASMFGRRLQAKDKAIADRDREIKRGDELIQTKNRQIENQAKQILELRKRPDVAAPLLNDKDREIQRLRNALADARLALGVAANHAHDVLNATPLDARPSDDIPF